MFSTKLAIQISNMIFFRFRNVDFFPQPFQKSHFLRTLKKFKKSSKRIWKGNANPISFILMIAVQRSEITIQENLVE